MELRDLPSVEELVRSSGVGALSHDRAVAAARGVLAGARAEIAAGHEPGSLVERLIAEAHEQETPRLRGVINATGVVLHTNLGRAPLAAAALEHAREIAGSYSNLEYDLAKGRRGSRHDHLAAILQRLTGADDALVVNNNAAALLLCLTALAENRSVIVSRGELIEIGDGFRIPEVLTVSHARLVEVGTTNRTRAADYDAAITDDTALLLRVAQSNFQTIGFTERPGLAELVDLAQRRGVPLIDDLGSGSLVAIGDEPLATSSVAGGADLVTFSGDKLLGGPQAGIIVGRSELVARLRRHPLQRALRPDKLTLAALEGTLLLYLDPERACRELPVLRMLQEPVDAVRERARELAERVGGEVVETIGRVGGGALPLLDLPSAACALDGDLAAQLRAAPRPVLAVVREGKTLLDCRTIAPGELEAVAAAVASCRPT